MAQTSDTDMLLNFGKPLAKHLHNILASLDFKLIGKQCLLSVATSNLLQEMF